MKAQTIRRVKKKRLFQQLELKIPPPIQTIVCMGCMKVIALGETHWMLSKRFYAFWYFVTLGCTFALWAIIDCYRHKTTIHPQDPSKTSVLITSGAFQYSRNPMYLSLYVCILSWGLYLGNLWGILFSISFPLSITILQILPEERALFKRFGASYQEYTREVRRWI